MMYLARFSIEAAVRDEDVARRIEAEKIAEGLDGDAAPGMGSFCGTASRRNTSRDSQAHQFRSAEYFRLLPLN
jgi:hypothetical protein